MILTVVGLDKRAMDHVEGHSRERQLNSVVFRKLYFDIHKPEFGKEHGAEK